MAAAAGDMVVLTQTLGGPYGSLVVVWDTRLLFSSQMRHMHLDPDSPSKFLGGVTGITREPATGVLASGADPRGKSYAMGC